MKTIQLGKKPYQFAESWAETTAQQQEKLLPLTLIDPADNGQAAQLRYTAARILLGDPKDLQKLAISDRWRLQRLASWVFTTRIQKKPFESITFQGVEYLLPAPDFADTSAIEVAMANINFMKMARADNPDPMAVLALIATLIRPRRKDLAAFRQNSKDWNGDEREPYNTTTADERTKAFQAIPIGQLMAMLQYFEHMNGRFLNAYKAAYEADPGDDEEDPLYTDGRGLITTFMDVGKAGVFGDFETVCSTNAHTVWIYLVDNNLKIKRANARARRERDDD